PGRMMPRNAAAAPATPRSESPTMMLMLVELRPGSVCPISSATMKSSSSSQRRRDTSISRRYATMPPPKLVPPITRKVQKIRPSDTRAEAPRRESLMVAGDRLAETVDHPGLGHAARQPVAHCRLQLHVELVGALAGLHMHVLTALELALVGELGHERRTDHSRPPERHVGLRRQAVSEVEDGHVLEDLRDPRALHDLERAGTGEERAQGGEHARRARDVGLEVLRRHGEHDVMGEEAPHPIAVAARRETGVLH